MCCIKDRDNSLRACKKGDKSSCTCKAQASWSQGTRPRLTAIITPGLRQAAHNCNPATDLFYHMLDNSCRVHTMHVSTLGLSRPCKMAAQKLQMLHQAAAGLMPASGRAGPAVQKNDCPLAHGCPACLTSIVRHSSATLFSCSESMLECKLALDSGQRQQTNASELAGASYSLHNKTRTSAGRLRPSKLRQSLECWPAHELIGFASCQSSSCRSCAVQAVHVHTCRLCPFPQTPVEGALKVCSCPAGYAGWISMLLLL